MSAVVVLVALFALAALACTLAERARQQAADVTAVLDAKWDAWAEPLRSETPVYDALVAETFRRQLEEGRTS